MAEELDNVSKACQVMGFSRDIYYCYKSAVDDGGVEAFVNQSRRTPNLKNRVDPAVEQAVLDYTIQKPAQGQVRACNELRKQGVFVSPNGVREIWLRHDLENFKKWIKALEDKVTKESLILTEAQVQTLEKKKLDDVAHGEIETAHKTTIVLRC